MRKIAYLGLFLTTLATLGFIATTISAPASSRGISSDIDQAYSSVCQISSGLYSGSGVMLRSGYVVTAAHLVDTNQNQKIDESEKTWTVEFPVPNGATFTASGIAIACAKQDNPFDLDVAIIKLDKRPPIKGVLLMSDQDYSNLKVGHLATVIGMLNGETPASVTDGRITSFERAFNHKINATVYSGNSGGGVFRDQKVIGIITKVGAARINVEVPVFQDRKVIGTTTVPHPHALANVALYVPVTDLRQFIKDEGLFFEVLPSEIKADPIPKKYYFFLGSVLLNLSLLVVVFNVLSWIQKK